MKSKKILLVADVFNWAWGVKSRNIQKFIDPCYEIDIWYYNESQFPKKKFDLYVTYTGQFLPSLLKRNIPRNKIVLGTTSHANRRYGFGNKLLNDQCLAIHANSMLLKNECKKNHKKVFYVPNGIDTNLFTQKPFPKNKNLVISFVAGSDAEYKGLNIAKEAISLLTGVELKINTNIYTNAIPIEKMPEFYDDTDIHLCSSSDEGTPNTCFEAAATGRPVITTRVGNMPEFIKDGINGFLVNRNPKEMAEKIKFLRDNKNKREEMGKNARKIVELWDWRNNIKWWRRMFEALIK